MRKLLLACMLITGCATTHWDNYNQEYEYLSSLSNPTPDQFKRKKSIERVLEIEKLKNLLNHRMFDTISDKDKNILEKAKRHHQTHQRDMLDRGNKNLEEENYMMAETCYELVIQFSSPDSQESSEAMDGIDKLLKVYTKLDSLILKFKKGK